MTQTTDRRDIADLALPTGRRLFLAVGGLLAIAVAALALVHWTSPDRPALDLARDRPSQNGLYAVSIAPVDGEPAVGPLASWIVALKTPGGEPVEGASIAVDGGMPEHAHGLPTQPQVTGALPGGRYRVDGVKFSMPGWWVLKFAISGPAGEDTVTFNLML